MSIEDIALENFSALTKSDTNSTKQSRQLHSVFHSLLSDDSKHDAATTNENRNSLIELIKEKNVFTTSLSTTWEKNYGCAEQYRCASTLYLISVMLQCYSVIIY